MASFTGTYKDELIATANVDTGVKNSARRAAAAYITGDFFTESSGGAAPRVLFLLHAGHRGARQGYPRRRRVDGHDRQALRV